MRCSKCGNESTSGRKFCPECGSPLSDRCARCGADNSPTAKFCEDCGAALGTSATAAGKQSDQPRVRLAATAAPESLEGERKTVTALFADIKGSTELEQDLDPEEARAIVDPALKLMIEAVHRYDGYVVQSTGDGIFALFGAPVAHEDHPQRALYAAIRMQEELRRYSDKLLADGRAPLEIRVGVNTGEVVVRSISTGAGNVEYTPIGHTTNLASRMQAVAPTGSIAITEHTRRLVEGYFTLKPRGPTRVKGVSEPVNVYEVTGLGPLRTRLQRSAGRGLTKFVGRDREMEAMRNAADLARSGRGQIVAAIAEAGAGKSRLFFEFKAKHQSDWKVLETFSVSHGKASAYLPVIDLLHNYFKIADDDDDRSRRAKVIGAVLALDRKLEDILPYLFSLLGIGEEDEVRRDWDERFDRLDEYLRKAQQKDPLVGMDAQVRKRRTLDAIKQILLRESLNQPLMVIFEDLHWIDEETQALLNLLADAIASARIILLVNYRPEYTHQWGSKTYYTQLRLDPLGRESADEMLTALLGVDPQLAPLKKLVAGKTEGNPFFIEEMVQAMFEDGALVRDGAVRLARPLESFSIPTTVQGVLASRIDRLPASEKDLLQTLAAIGNQFPLALVKAVLSSPGGELTTMLDHLQLAEFIYEQPAAGDIEYTFKHALTHDVAYSSMLIERRKLLHGRIGAAVEAHYSSSIDDHLDELAHHYGKSGNPAKAFEYQDRAGRQAVKRSAYREAARNFAAAIEFLERLPPGTERERREFALQTSLGAVLMATEGWAAPETERAYLRAEQLAPVGATAEQHFALLVGLFGTFYVAGNLAAARERQKQIWKFVNQHPQPIFILEATHHDWSAALSAGELEAAQRHVERGLALYEEKLRAVPVPLYSAHHPAVCGYGWGAQILWLRGYPDAARRHADKAVPIAQELGDLVSVAWGLGNRAVVCRMMREVDPALEMAEAAIASSEQGGFPYHLRNARIVKAWALAERGHPDEGPDRIREEIAALSETRSVLQQTLYFATLAEVCERAERIDEGLKAAADALDLVAQTGERFWEAEIHRLRGELLLKQNGSNSAQAQASFEGALEIARNQGAKSLELRAAASLARLLRDTNRRAEARAILANIYNWFTEGFDTADLKDARAELDELSAL